MHSQTCDSNRDGSLDRKELYQLLLKLKVHPTKKEFQGVLSQMPYSAFSVLYVGCYACVCVCVCVCVVGGGMDCKTSSLAVNIGANCDRGGTITCFVHGCLQTSIE